MAPTFVKALSLFSFASLAFTGVFAGANTTKDVSVCDTPATECKPFYVTVSLGLSPGGVKREAILTNGTLPGPPLKLKLGECVDFTVHNKLPYVTSVHFHGIRQLGTPWADGAPGLSQTPIEVGATYNYRWTASQEGVYFYHAHYKGQMMDGLYGAILIEAEDSEKPFASIDSSDVEALNAAYSSIEPVFVSDWSSFTFDEYFQIEKDANVDIACTDAIVLNAKGSTYCPGVPALMANAQPSTPVLLNGGNLTAKGCIPGSNPVIQGNFSRNLAALPPKMYDVCTPYSGENYTHEVDPADGWAALSFINSGGFISLQLSIDDHKLFIFEYNGHFIVPQIVDQVLISTGERVSLFVKLDKPAADYQIRVANFGLNQVISGFGVLSYKGSTGKAGFATQNLGSVNTTVVTKFVPGLAAPFPAQAPATAVDKTFILDIHKDSQQPTEAWAWTLSGVSAYDHSRDDVDPPLLFQDPADIPESDLVLRTNSDDWVDLIVKIRGPLAQPHPMHKHANKFYVIGSGIGSFPYATVAEAAAAGLRFNFATAPYLDTFTNTPANGNDSWLAIRYHSDTPGAWFFHCHVQTHFSGGMAVALLDGIDDFPVPPSDVGDVCYGNGTSGDDGSDSGSDKGSGNGSGSGSGSGDGGYPSATNSGGGPATYTNGSGITPYTGAASMIQTSLTSALGLLVVFLAVYA